MNSRRVVFMHLLLKRLGPLAMVVSEASRIDSIDVADGLNLFKHLPLAVGFEQQHVQLSLFDRRNLAEIRSPAFPGERLMACFNSALAEERTRKREDLLQATEQALEKIVKQVARRTRTPLKAAEIGAKVGKVIHRFKVAKHFELLISDGHFSYTRRTQAIAREAELDGLYVLRTS